MPPIALRLLFSLALLSGTAAAAPKDDLLKAAERGDVAAARTAIKAGASIQGRDGAVALCTAAWKGQKEVVEFLLGSGIRVDENVSSGETALMIAAVNGQADIVRLLLSRGAKADFVGRGESGKESAALVGAARSGSLEIARLLLGAGANPNRVAGLALDLANFKGDVEMYQLLLKHGAKPPQVHPAIRHGLEGAAEAEAELKKQTPAGAVAALGLTELLLPAKEIPIRKAGQKAPAATKANRLAIIADEAHSAEADLLTAELSNQPTFQLIERQEIARILEEQKLSADFSTDAASAVRVGALLGADTLVLITTENSGNASLGRSRVVRVNPGLVLDSSFHAAPIPDSTSWAAELAARVRDYAAKAVAPDAIALSLLNIRSSVGTPATRDLESTLALLLADRLVREPHFHLLERQAFDTIAQEASLRRGPSASFWAGSYLVDGSFEGGLKDADPIDLTVQLQPASKGKPLVIKATGVRSQLPKLLDEVAAKVNQALARTAPPLRADPKAEAEEYLHEAQWAQNAGLYRKAYEAAEAAWGLGLQTPAVGKLRVDSTSHLLMRTIADLHSRVGSKLPSEHNFMFSRDLFHHPFRGAGCPTQEELLRIAAKCLSSYRAGLQPGFLGEDSVQVKEWLRTGEPAMIGVLKGIQSIDTVSDSLRLKDQLDGVRSAVQSALAESLALAKKHPDATDEAIELASLCAGLVPFWTQSPEARVGAMRSLLSQRFASKDEEGRARVRNALGNGNAIFIRNYQKLTGDADLSPRDFPQPSRRDWQAFNQKLEEELQKAQEPELRLHGAWMALSHVKDGSSEHAEAVKRIMASLWEMRDVLAGDPVVFRETVNRIDITKAGRLSGVSDSKVPAQKREFSPEVRDLRRRLFLHVCQHADEILPYTQLLDMKSLSAAEAAEVNKALTAHLAAHPEGAGTSPNYSEQVSLIIATAPAATAPAAAAASTFAPLRAERFWAPQDQAGKLLKDLRPCSYVWAEGRLWIYGEARWPNQSKGPGYIFQVELPSLRTVAIQMPEFPAKKELNYVATPGLVVTPEHLFVGMPDRGVAVYDRRAKKWEVVGEVFPQGDNMAAVVSGADEKSAAFANGQRSQHTMVAHGGWLYFLIASETDGGVARYHPKLRKTEILASTRRNPAQTPLDNAALRVSSLSIAGANIEITASQLDSEGKPTSSVLCTFLPDRLSWSQPVPIVRPEGRFRAVPQMAGFQRFGAISESLGQTAEARRFSMFLDFSRAPEPRMFLECVVPPKAADDPAPRQGPGERVPGVGWVAPGFVIPVENTGFWFVPQQDFLAYLGSTPEAAEIVASFSPPFPGATGTRP